MTERMTRWGVGPSFALLSLAYGAAVVALQLAYPVRFRMDFIPYWILLTAGMTAIGIGLLLYVAGVMTVMRAYNADTLCTHGVCRLCRHPIYAAWVLFLVPGVALLLDSWLALTVPVVMYVIVRILVRKEEQYLEHRFGHHYRAYQQRVPPILPLGWLKRK